MGLLDRVIDNERTIADICGEIKTAANEKGADIRDLQAFSEWPAQIRTIDATPTVWEASSVTSMPTRLIPRQRITVPTGADDIQFPTDIEIPMIALRSILWGCKELEVPSYFENIRFPFDWSTSTVGNPSQIFDTLVWNPASFPTYFGYQAYTNCHFFLSRVYAPECTGTPSQNFFIGSRSTGGSLVLYFPKLASSMPLMIYGLADVTGSELPLVTSFGPSGNAKLHICGALELPSCQTYNGFDLPDNGDYTLTLKLPAIVSMGTSSGTLQSSSGHCELYLGPNLVTLPQSARFVERVTSGNLVIHIPAGDTTTKATLDSAGVAYTQDYVI